MENVTIILQGVVQEEQIKLWKKYHKNSNVIISTWEDTKFNFEGNGFTNWLPKKWKLIKNQYPLIRFRPQANLDYQIISTLKALEEVETKWVIKMRCDEYWSNIDKIFKMMRKHPNKLVSGSMFFRKWGMYPFHCSDKILGGLTDNIRLMYESTLHNLETNLWDTNIPESQLGLGYVIGKERDDEFSTLSISLNTYNKLPEEKQTVKAVMNASGIAIKELSEILSKQLRPLEGEDLFDWGLIERKLIYTKNVISNASKMAENLVHSKPIDDKFYMKKWFEIIDVNELKPYISTRNFGDERGRVWYRNDFDNEENDCLTDINSKDEFIN